MGAVQRSGIDVPASVREKEKAMVLKWVREHQAGQAAAFTTLTETAWDLVLTGVHAARDAALDTRMGFRR